MHADPKTFLVARPSLPDGGGVRGGRVELLGAHETRDDRGSKRLRPAGPVQGVGTRRGRHTARGGGGISDAKYASLHRSFM